ncbi:hypothetical protein [Calothrix sp. NIES-2098]|uniref:hypothetical protein n=1 Tax=Calothrix sp. NIES-2098 TaxID=1954171 RepID=UPI000B5FB3BE|nr:hypothetical protein NIES2098_16920 [Calothrix sp. NIES-2098]
MLGINLTLLVGPQKPEFAPRMLIDAIESIEVTHTDRGRSGFQIVFQVGRSQKMDWKDYQLINNPLIQTFNRVIMTISIGAIAQVLVDGIITNLQLTPSTEPGESTYTITGEDISIMMDLEEKSVEHPEQDEASIVEKLIGNYAKYGLVPKIVKPSLLDKPLKNERIPVQLATDLEYIQALAERFGFVFYVTPGPISNKSTAYWGPPQRQTQPQKALTVDMDADTNVESINFQNNALASTTINGSVQDRKTNVIQPVERRSSDRLPALANESALTTQSHVRLRQFRETGRDINQATSRAQAMINRSIDDVVTVNGELDTLIYGGLLQIGGTIGLRGAGYDYDGLYYVKRVTHKIREGEYKQSFTLTREGLGSTKQILQI